MISYGTSSDEYERRARSQLDSGTPDGLFYAAFELRCGIEARMDRYLEAHERITKLRKKGWRIAQKATQLDRAFPTKGKSCRFTILDPSTRTPKCKLVYIPVSNELKKGAEKIGEYLHNMKQARADDDPWWDDTRKILEKIYAELRRVNRGALMGAPLRFPNTNQIHLEIEVDKADQEMLEVIKAATSGKEPLTVKITYE